MKISPYDVRYRIVNLAGKIIATGYRSWRAADAAAGAGQVVEGYIGRRGS